MNSDQVAVETNVIEMSNAYGGQKMTAVVKVVFICAIDWLTPEIGTFFQGKILPRNLAVDLGTAPDLGQDLLGNFESVQQQRVPMEGLDVHEECSRSVGDVGDVKTTVGTARQVLQTGK
jgi:hypothetical protein